MTLSTSKNSPQNKIFILYIIGFLFALHLALPAYITSTYLSNYATEQWIGLLYTLASLLTIFSFALVPYILERFGNYRTVYFFLVCEVISLLCLAFGTNVYILASAFILNFVTLSIISFNIDIFLEQFSSFKSTGKIRGFYLTVINSAWVIAALLTGLILKDSDYFKIYLASMLLMIPIIGLVFRNFKNFDDPHYHKTPLWKTFIEIWKNKNILDVFIVNFLLQFFFSWMVIYTPIYLYEHVGFSWSVIGIIFAIMLLPFPLFEWPLGRLADNKYGEKEMLSIGFIIMAITTALIVFIPGKNLFLWISILFLTRVGASMVEVMSETYFFKKVPDTSLNTISFFRTMRPIAYLLSPIIATVILSFFDIKYLFIFLGLLMFYGLRFTITMKDTR